MQIDAIPEYSIVLYCEVFNLRRIWTLFLGLWAGILFLSFFTASELQFFQRLLFTGVLALVAPILSLTNGRTKQKVSKARSNKHNQNVDVHLPSDPKVLYRVRNGKIYKGLDAVPVYEIREDKVYSVLSPKPAYHIKSSKVYRYLEASPILEIKGNRIYHNLDSKIAYEMTEPKEM